MSGKDLTSWLIFSQSLDQFLLVLKGNAKMQMEKKLSEVALLFYF
jgi:hypothetical protein